MIEKQPHHSINRTIKHLQLKKI